MPGTHLKFELRRKYQAKRPSVPGGLLQAAGRLLTDDRESLRHKTNMKPAGNSTVVAFIRSPCRILFYVRLPNSQRQTAPFDPSLLSAGDCRTSAAAMATNQS
jgi:hypothetical protein